MGVKVMLAFSNNLFSEGIARLLEDHKGVESCFFNEEVDIHNLLKDLAPDIVLLVPVGYQPIITWLLYRYGRILRKRSVVFCKF